MKQDLRSAARQMVRWPGLTLVTVLSLAGPMGLNTSLFSLFNASWLRPWDVADVARVRVVQPRVSVEEWQDWADHTRTFQHLAAVSDGPYVRLAGRPIQIAFVSASYLDALGVHIAFGQGFSSDDDRDAANVAPAIVSHRLWQSRLDGDPDVLGRVLTLAPASAWQERVSVRVDGVGPPGFDGPEMRRTHLWLPLAAMARFTAAESGRGAEWQVGAVGRLADRVSPGEAQAELSTLSRRFRSSRSLESDPILVRSTDRLSRSPLSPQAQLTITLFLIGGAVITLVACANVANLQLARGYARSGETAVRLSLGATRGRIVRELLTEAFLISALAGLLGLAIAARLPALVTESLLASGSPHAAEMFRMELPVDGRVFAWAALVSTLACMSFGLAPALQCARISVRRALQDAHGQSTRSLKTSLLSAQAIVSVIALALAGLMLRSADFDRTGEVDALLRELTFVRLEVSHVEDPSLRQSANDLLRERLESMLGPGSVAGLNADPLVPGPGGVRVLGVSADYFDLLGMPIVAGRSFLPAERADRTLVVNEAFARRFWPGGGAIGRAFHPPEQANDPEVSGREVIGIVRDRGLSGADVPAAYYPVSASAHRLFLIRDPARKAWREIAPLMARAAPGVETRIQTGREWGGSLVGPLLVSAWVAGGFGLLAVALGGLGFFTLSEYAVRQRTREIGVRVALGATRRDVLGAVLRPASLGLVRGLLIGGAGALVLGFAMRRAQLPAGVDPVDPFLYACVAAVLGLVGLSAAWVPARRALAIEPSEALRRE